MKKVYALASVVVLVCVASLVVYADGLKIIKEILTGYEEVPSVSTSAGGEFRARINNEGTAIEYELSYGALEGAVQQAHIHLGQKGANGGIAVFLCTNLGNGPAGTQACPPAPATITGTITAADVIGPTAQGLAAGEFGEFLAALRAGKTYANVHSAKFPNGEIRSQIDQNHGNHEQK